MLKLIASLAALTFISACTTTATFTSSADPRPSTVTLGAGASVPTLSSDPAMNTFYLPGGPN